MQERSGERRYGLDWLRIGAFALLILYHIGMFFVPWDWHVKTAEPVKWLEFPMLATAPWRLALLFFISGVASRILLGKTAGAGRFARSRSWRLLVPLFAGLILFVAPQPWAELREKAGYAHGFWHFWMSDYFRFGEFEGVEVPTWNHLWFVAYLWAYTMLLALLALLPGPARSKLQRGFDKVFAGWRLFVLPFLLFWAARHFLYPVYGETHGLFDDPYGHAVYGFAFVMGVGLARSQPAWAAIHGHWRPALAAAILGYAIYGGLHAFYPDIYPSDFIRATATFGRALMTWGGIVALVGWADTRLHRDSPARRYLTEAIFPYYIAHQTIIVLVGHWLGGYALGTTAEFAIILAATVAGCALTYEVAKRIGWLRPLLGLGPRLSQRRPSG